MVVLSEVLKHNQRDQGLRPEIEDVITTMFRYDTKLEPDSLARAAFFVVKSNHGKISLADVKMIRNDGGKQNYSWPALIQVIRSQIAQTK